jgi:hypothetical protein
MILNMLLSLGFRDLGLVSASPVHQVLDRQQKKDLGIVMGLGISFLGFERSTRRFPAVWDLGTSLIC